LGLYLNGLVNIYCHDGNGSQDSATGDNSRNKRSWFMRFVLKGGNLHNNHHSLASGYSNEHRLGEYDFFGRIIRKYFAV
jgi:fatty-acid desaturase